jgi:hypothetical protein
MGKSDRRRRRIRILRGDILVAALLVGRMIGARLRWPEKAIADVAIPLALLIAFIFWRQY